MTTSTVATKEQTVKINDAVLTMFLESLAEVKDHSDERYDTTTRSLGWAIIKDLGGEGKFLELHKKIAKQGLDDVDCSFTNGTSVKFYHDNEVEVHWACAAVASINEENFLLKKVFDRINNLEPKELGPLFNERPDKNGKVSKKREALIALMVDICVEDFCRNFIAFSENITGDYSSFIQ